MAEMGSTPHTSGWVCDVCGQEMMGEPELNRTCRECQCWAEKQADKLAWRRLARTLDEAAHKPVNEWR